jgi:hypothetical protein
MVWETHHRNPPSGESPLGHCSRVQPKGTPAMSVCAEPLVAELSVLNQTALPCVSIERRGASAAEGIACSSQGGQSACLLIGLENHGPEAVISEEMVDDGRCGPAPAAVEAPGRQRLRTHRARAGFGRATRALEPAHPAGWSFSLWRRSGKADHFSAKRFKCLPLRTTHGTRSRDRAPPAVPPSHPALL